MEGKSKQTRIEKGSIVETKRKLNRLAKIVYPVGGVFSALSLVFAFRGAFDPFTAAMFLVVFVTLAMSIDFTRRVVRSVVDLVEVSRGQDLDGDSVIGGREVHSGQDETQGEQEAENK